MVKLGTVTGMFDPAVDMLTWYPVGATALIVICCDSQSDVDRVTVDNWTGATGKLLDLDVGLFPLTVLPAAA
jgi:hypothetical protein